MAIATVLLFDIFKESIFCKELPNYDLYSRWLYKCLYRLYIYIYQEQIALRACAHSNLVLDAPPSTRYNLPAYEEIR